MKFKILILMFATSVAYGFRLEPMYVEFEPNGKGATKIFRVDNDSKERIAVKFKAYVREINRHGRERRIPTDHFKMFPEQFSLSPNDSRAVRIVYKGPSNLEKEVAYRLVATQLPVDFKNKTKRSGINFLFEYVASAYVTTAEFIPKIEIEDLSRSDDGTLKISLRNNGKKHRQLSGVKVTLRDPAGQKFYLNETTINDWSGETILAGNRRTIGFSSEMNLIKDNATVEVRD